MATGIHRINERPTKGPRSGGACIKPPHRESVPKKAKASKARRSFEKSSFDDNPRHRTRGGAAGSGGGATTVIKQTKPDLE